jgi:hypothetical protein
MSEICHVCKRTFPGYPAMMRHMQHAHPATFDLIQSQLAEQRAAAAKEGVEERRITEAMRSDPANLSPWDREALSLED